MNQTPKRPSLRDRARIAEQALGEAAKTQALYVILSQKVEALERLLAAHHGTDVVTEEQIQLCVTCAPLLEMEA